jgi:hypothetical protein
MLPNFGLNEEDRPVAVMANDLARRHLRWQRRAQPPGEGVPMMAESQAEARDHIFISYRRDDARGASGRLYDWLRIGFGRERVFRDVHSIGDLGATARSRIRRLHNLVEAGTRARLPSAAFPSLPRQNQPRASPLVASIPPCSLGWSRASSGSKTGARDFNTCVGRLS